MRNTYLISYDICEEYVYCLQPRMTRGIDIVVELEAADAERVKMGFDLFETSRTIVISGLRGRAPDGVVTREALFLRTYGRDFDPPTRARIACYFRRGDGRAALDETDT